jgi:urease accessory protein
MQSKISHSVLVFIIVLTIPLISHAHSGESASGFYAGLFHPVLGYDHLLAMVCVGILSAQMGGRAVWSVPVVFVCVMAVGGIIGMFNVFLPIVEIGIVLSVFVLGMAIAAEKKLSLPMNHFVVALFAIFHGHAHGTEMPLWSDPGMYALGFIISTSILHLIGVLIGFAAAYTKTGHSVLRHCGALIAVFGLYLLINKI